MQIETDTPKTTFKSIEHILIDMYNELIEDGFEEIAAIMSRDLNDSKKEDFVE